MSTRVYLPSAPDLLNDLTVSGGVGPPPLVGHAVTRALREAYPEGDEEAWEYAALTAAALDSLALLGQDVPARRVVIAVDIADVVAVERPEPSLVRVDGVVPLHAVAAVHVDSVEAEASVSAARDAWVAADDGDEDAARLLDRTLDHELGWWATQELADLVAELGVAPED